MLRRTHSIQDHIEKTASKLKKKKKKYYVKKNPKSLKYIKNEGNYIDIFIK